MLVWQHTSQFVMSPQHEEKALQWAKRCAALLAHFRDAISAVCCSRWSLLSLLHWDRLRPNAPIWQVICLLRHKIDTVKSILCSLSLLSRGSLHYFILKSLNMYAMFEWFNYGHNRLHIYTTIAHNVYSSDGHPPPTHPHALWNVYCVRL